MDCQKLSHWISGKSVPPESQSYFDVLNPVDDSVCWQAARGDVADVEKAVGAAAEAFETLQHSLPREREAWLRQSADVLEHQQDEFVDILIDEVGSPLSKARREVATATGVLRAAAGAVRHLAGKTMPTDVPGRMSFSTRRPLGVVAGITPFNVPLIKNIKHVAMPLAMGNTVVLLPSEESPAMGLRVAKLLSDAGVPPGSFNVVTGIGQEIGDALTSHPAVRHVGFTGSTRVGRHVGEICGRLGKRCTLELGGKNPLVVMDDADLGLAVQAGVMGAFLFQGQICMSSSRIYVQERLYDRYLSSLVQAAGQLGRGDLRNAHTVVGPIINGRQRERIRQHLKDATERGGLVQTGGVWDENCCHPTVLTDVPQEALLHHEETFGPVTTVQPFGSMDDAMRLANDTPFGLSAAICTSNLKQAMRFANESNAGMVHVNAGTIQEEPHVPFGGNGASGMGRESTDAAVADLTQWKWVTVQP